MKITTIQIHPEGSSEAENCDLSFRDPKRHNPFNVKAVFGLDAENIVPRYYGVSGNQTKKYFDLMLESREIVLRIELNPSFAVNESYSDLRDRMYRIIAAARTGVVELRFKNENDCVAVTKGFIKRFEAPTSTKTPEIQITIECEEPMLKAPNLVNVDINGFDPGYTILVDELSTAPHGFHFTMQFTGPLDVFTVEDPTDPGWMFQIEPGTDGFQTNDVLFFSSEAKNKYLYIERSGIPIHLADRVKFESIWPIMFPGETKFSFNVSSLMTWTSITYYPTYWGV